MIMSIILQPYFWDEPAAHAKLEEIVWPNGPVCMRCGATHRIGATRTAPTTGASAGCGRLGRAAVDEIPDAAAAAVSPLCANRTRARLRRGRGRLRAAAGEGRYSRDRSHDREPGSSLQCA